MLSRSVIDAPFVAEQNYDDQCATYDITGEYDVHALVSSGLELVLG